MLDNDGSQVKNGRFLFSRYWIDSSTHIVPPSDQWTLERLCSPLLFPFHYDTVCLHFLLSGTLFVMYGCSTSQRQKCRLCQSHANTFMVEEGVEVLGKCKKGKCMNGPRCKNVLKEQWNRQRNCCEISPFKVFFQVSVTPSWVTCFIDIFVEHLVLFWAILLLLDFFLILIHIDLRKNSCDPRIQSLNLPCFKSMEAQQGYLNVSCLQEGIEQFSDTHVPDSYTVHVLHVFFKTQLQRRVLYSVLLTFEVTCSSNYWGHEVSPMVSLDSSLRAWKRCGPLILDCLHLFALFVFLALFFIKMFHLYLYISMFMIIHYFNLERLQLHKGLQINLDVILLLKCRKTHTKTHQIEIRFGVLKLF